MIRKRIIVLFLISGLIIIGSWKSNIYNLLGFQNSPIFLSINTKMEAKPEPVKTPLLSPSSSPNPEINPDRIWSHLESLLGERYTENDRELIRNYLIKQLEQFGLTPSLQSFQQGVNIVAKRPGNSPQAPTLLIGAHYDTVPNSPGADDNASGIGVILEVARLFGSKPTTNSLEIVFFDQEEAGLLGSLAFTSRPENIQNLRNVIILDMVGYACRVEGCQQYPPGLNVAPLLQTNGVTSPNKGEFLVVVGEAQHRDLLASFQGISSGLSKPNLPPVVPLPIPFKGLLTPDVLRSDHAPFWYQNLSAVLVTDTANLRSPYYHQPTDTLANLDREFLMGSAQVIINVVARLLE